ncbi:hypothetical protein ABK040_004491 [Willaertia magna]
MLKNNNNSYCGSSNNGKAMKKTVVDPNTLPFKPRRNNVISTDNEIITSIPLSIQTITENIKINGLTKSSRCMMQDEKEAALFAIKTGIYGVWRSNYLNPTYNTVQDCARIGPKSKCFCDHSLEDHMLIQNDKITFVECKNCKDCKRFEFIPTKPEEIGENWLVLRNNFNIDKYRVKCKCKHTHAEHSPKGMKRCLAKGCKCCIFDSAFLCVVCDKPWNEHTTTFETETERIKQGLPVREDFIPFSELPQLQQAVFRDKDIERIHKKK